MTNLSELEGSITEINQILEQYLPENTRENSLITETMSYSVLSGGKRLRPIMLLEAFRLFNSDKELEKLLAHPYAAALEFIQAYSLVHDDLPAMDNDMYRRGQLTTHAKYGHAMGILSGDALLNYSFETILNAMKKIVSVKGEYKSELYSRATTAASYIFNFSGYNGMINGQVYDVEGMAKDCSGDSTKCKLMLKRLYELKTSGLFKAALCAGACLGGADESELTKMESLGYHIGLAFQIRDDILDITSSVTELGKDTGNDVKNDKLTVASLLGIEAANKLVEEHTGKALDILSQLSGNTDFLKDLFLLLVNRNK